MSGYASSVGLPLHRPCIILKKITPRVPSLVYLSIAITSYQLRDKLRTINYTLDKLNSAISTKEKASNRRARLQKKINRLLLRRQRLRDITHYALIKHLLTTSSVVVVGALDGRAVQQSRNLASCTKRDFAGLAHSLFIKRLQEQAKFYPHARVVVIEEHFTSQYVQEMREPAWYDDACVLTTGLILDRYCPQCQELTRTPEEMYLCKHCQASYNR